MDKTPETNPSPEIPNVPENWNFPEKTNPNCKIGNIDLDSGSLSIRLQNSYRDYFFDPEGNPLGRRIYIPEYAIDIRRVSILATGENLVGIDIFERKGYENYTLISVYFPEIEAGKDSFNNPENNLVDNRLEQLVNFIYGFEGQLTSVVLGGVFMKDPDGNTIPRPISDISFPIDFIRSGIRGKYYKKGGDMPRYGQHDWLSDPGASAIRDKFKAPKEEGANKIGLFDTKGEKIFAIEWEVKEEVKARFLIVQETHLPSKIIRILELPLQIDPEEVMRAALSQPPYPKNERGKLIVPWTNIDRIVGASLSYSYPPPKKPS